MSEPTTFLSDADVRRLTGKRGLDEQIAMLRNMGIPFFINALGRPIVPRAAVESGSKAVEKPEAGWTPRVLASHG